MVSPLLDRFPLNSPAMMMPFALAFLVLWTLFLLGYWALGLPLGLAATYVYP